MARNGANLVNIDRMSTMNSSLLMTFEVPSVRYTAVVDEALRA
jgi:hypothetical protein